MPCLRRPGRWSAKTGFEPLQIVGSAVPTYCSRYQCIVYSALTYLCQWHKYRIRYIFYRIGYVMPEQTDWEARAANLLKAELKRKGVTYSQLVEKLADIGVQEKEVNIRNKLARGKFSAAFLIQCLSAIGCSSLRLEDY